MATALKSNFVYSGIGSGIQAPEFWSITNWEPENVTDSWEWEDPSLNCSSRHGEGQLRMHSGDSAAPASSVVTLASSAGASQSGWLSHHHPTGNGMPSISSGVPSVTGGWEGKDSVVSSLVKHELDENGAEQAVLGTPASGSDQGDSFFASRGQSFARENDERAEGEADRTPTVRGLSDGSTGTSEEGYCQNATLKLGRRMCFEDSAEGGQAKPSSPCPSPPGKKQRPLSPTTQIPRCQVEGCKADLSGCKDYHKRHKVCEMHSKAPKAIAAGIEQRFCQQCSRFHVLKEFDEDKRSCRRRLAGHNQRRRKPQPETHSLFSLGNPFLHTKLSPAAIEDSKPSSFLHPHRGFLLDYVLHGYGHNLTRSSPWSLKSRSDTIPTFQLETPVTTSKPFSTLHLGGHPLLEEPLGSLGQGLSLSSSTGGALGSLEQSRLGSGSQALSSVSGMIDSGRALSLLSSQSWASCPLPGASTPMALGLSQATLEQLVASSSTSDSSGRGSLFAHQLQQPSGGSSMTSERQVFDTQFSVQSGDLHSAALNCGLTATGNATHQPQGCANYTILGGLGGAYEDSNSMLGLVGGGQSLDQALRNSGFGDSHEGRLTIDLMHMPSLDQAHHGPHSAQSNGVHSGVSVSGRQYSGFSSMRPFDSSSFSSHIL